MSELLTLTPIFVIYIVLAVRYGHKKLKIFQLSGVPTYLSGHWILLYLFIATPSIIAGSDGWWFFLSAYFFVTVHEYGHALTAQRLGHRPDNITLWPFSGLASIDGDWHKKPRDEFWITVNGPMTNLVMALAFMPMALTGNKYFVWFFEINTILLAFNVLPIYPMDGGRLLRVFLETFSDDWIVRTKWAVRISLVVVLFAAPILWFYWSGVGAVLVVVIALMGWAGEKAHLENADIEELMAECEADEKKRREKFRKLAEEQAGEKWPDDEERQELYVNDMVRFDAWFQEQLLPELASLVKKRNDDKNVEAWADIFRQKTQDALDYLKDLSEEEHASLNADLARNEEQATELTAIRIYHGREPVSKDPKEVLARAKELLK